MKTDLLRRAALAAGAVPLLIAAGYAAAAPSAAAATGHGRQATPQSIPLPPKGLHPHAIGKPWRGAHVKTWVQTLSPAACAALQNRHPEAAPDCRVKNIVIGAKGLPLPAGTHFSAPKAAVSNAAASLPYYKFDFSFVQCNPGLGGCGLWNTNLEVIGVYNDAYVYQWHVYCTPASRGASNKCTWSGYSGNGGETKSGWPSKAMTFGENNAGSATVAGTSYNFSDGQRVWVDVSGSWFDWTKF